MNRLGPSCAALSVDRVYPFVHRDAVDRYAKLNVLLFAGAVALADDGCRIVVVETVFTDLEIAAIARRGIGSRDHVFVAVTCPLSVLEAREAARGNRRVGLAREQHERVLQGIDYDLRLDSSCLTVEEEVNAIVGLLPELGHP